MLSESQFKSWFRKTWDGWVESYEPRRGSGVGIPDLQIVIDGHILPIELKVGKIVGDVLVVNEVRPDQIGWHRRINDVGIGTIFLIGVGEGSKPDAMFAVLPKAIVKWKDGIDLFEVDQIKSLSQLKRYIRCAKK